MSICAPFTGWRIHMSYGSPALFKVRVPRCLSVEFSLSKLVSVSNKSWTFQIKSSLLNLFAHTSLSCFISKLFLIHVLHDEEKNWIASNTLQIRFSTTKQYTYQHTAGYSFYTWDITLQMSMNAYFCTLQEHLFQYV